MHADFDPQPILRDPLLCLRPLNAADLEPLYAVANDPLLWAGHPATNRHERRVFTPYFDMLLASRTTLAATLADTGQIIGCSRYYTAPDHEKAVSIGYTFLGRNWWGGDTNFAMKRLMLDHAFACVETVWLHIDPANIRSQCATEKLGAVCAYSANIRLGGKDGFWQCWRLDRAVWAQTNARYRARPT
ncbi:GNAT family N-acetyltransferase [Sulfitobacter sp. F26204]|uniref:GNAT family N-acetyltransferase n=1 Tax=Sulfitobacter sp. F26204 TaxID=2996014 RepID=UPI00225DD593|nr:GNAT family N-acetyltransferase [Sulfitobacter sp. F26204]MCX7557939.1 GNAT family N-acetyltransferase [Sulfitobacter sp. F26204]